MNSAASLHFTVFRRMSDTCQCWALYHVLDRCAAPQAVMYHIVLHWLINAPLQLVTDEPRV